MGKISWPKNVHPLNSSVTPEQLLRTIKENFRKNVRQGYYKQWADEYKRKRNVIVSSAIEQLISLEVALGSGEGALSIDDLGNIRRLHETVLQIKGLLEASTLLGTLDSPPLMQMLNMTRANCERAVQALQKSRQ